MIAGIYHGKGKDVSLFTDADRAYFGLATSTTIIEICGDDDLMDEMWEYCVRKKIVGYDTETTGLNFFKHRPVLAQIGDEERQYLIWLDRTNPARLLQVLQDPEIVKIGLNLKFDLTFGLYHFGMVEGRARNVVDVQLTAQVLTCGIYDSVGFTMRMTGMANLAKHWLGLNIPKDDELRIGWEGWDPISFQERIDVLKLLNDPEAAAVLIETRRKKLLYAADDVNIPILIAKAHKPWIMELGLAPIVNLENRFLPVLADIETRGMGFSMVDWMNLAHEAAEGAKTARRQLDELFDVEVTVEIDVEGKALYSRDKKYTSTDQLLELIRHWMWENCGVDVIATNKHFKESLLRYERIPQARVDLLFQPRMVTDPDNPDKKKKKGYDKMKDILHSMWDLYKGYLPDNAFILPGTDSDVLKFFKVIYEADPDDIAEDAETLPTTFGLPPILVDPILALRGHTKNVTTYGENWKDILAADGRVHTNFVQAALSTGRCSSRPNLQNLPASPVYRACFKAEEGYKMVGADYSQIEPRVLAHLSKDPTYMRVFWSENPNTEGFKMWCDDSVTEPLDLYTEVGKEIGQIPAHYTKLDTKGDEDSGIEPKPDGAAGRTDAKVSNLGLGYGTGKNKFHGMLCITTGMYKRRQATDDLYDVYWDAMKVVKRYLDSSSDLTSPQKSKRKVRHPYAKDEVTYAETILGRKRFFEESNPGWWTQGRNMPIQGAAGGDMLKQAAIELTEWAWANDIDGGLVNLIHDELLAEVREDQSERFKKAMSYFMEKVGSEMCPSVPITAKAYTEDFWRK